MLLLLWAFSWAPPSRGQGEPEPAGAGESSRLHPPGAEPPHIVSRVTTNGPLLEVAVHVDDHVHRARSLAGLHDEVSAGPQGDHSVVGSGLAGHVVDHRNQ